MTISERCEYFTAMLMFKAINKIVPNYLSDSNVMAGETHDRDTRLSESLDVHIPSHNSSTLKRSFICNSSVLWNALPEVIKASDSIFTFEKIQRANHRSFARSINLEEILKNRYCNACFEVYIVLLCCHLYFIWIVTCIWCELPYIVCIRRQLSFSSLDVYL